MTLRRVLWIPLVALAAAALVASLAAVWVLRTESGSRWLLDRVDSGAETVAVRYRGGTLAGSLQLDSLRLVTTAGTLQLTDVALQWTLACLLRGSVCVENLHIGLVDWQSAAVDTEPTAAPDRAAWSLPVRLQLAQGRIDELRIRAGALDERIQGIEVTAAASSTVIDVAVLQFDWRNAHWTANASLEIDAAVIRSRINVRHPDLRQFGVAELPDRENSLDIGVQLDGTLDALQVEMALQGRFSGTAAGQLDLSAGEPAVELDIQLVDAVWPMPAGEAGMTDSRLRLSGSLSDWSLEAGGLLKAPGSPFADVPLDPRWQLSARGDAGSARLDRLELEAGPSRLQGVGRVAWQGGLTTSLQLDVEAFDPALVDAGFPGALSGQLTMNARQSATGWALEVEQLELSGRLMDEELQLRFAGMADSSRAVVIDVLEFMSGANRLQVTGRYDGTWQLDGRVDLSRLDTLPLPQAIAGSVSGSVVASGEGLPTLEIDLTVSGLEHPAGAIEFATIRGVVDPHAGARSDLRVSAANVLFANRAWQSVEVHLEGRPGSHQLNLAVDGEIAATATVDGVFDDAWNWRGRVDRFVLGVPTGDWQLVMPVAVSWQRGSATAVVADHCWRPLAPEQSGELCFAFDQPVGSSGQLAFEFSEFPLTQWLPQDAAGSLEGVFRGNGRVAWAPGVLPTLEANLEAVDARLRLVGDADSALARAGEFEEVAFERLAAQIIVRADRWSSEGVLQAGPYGTAEWRIAIDPQQEARPLSGTLAVRNFQLRILAPLLVGVDRLEGQLQVDGTLAGTLDQPLYEGDIRLVGWGARLSGLPLPIEFERGMLDIRVRQAEAVLAGSWYLGEDRLELAGSGDWSDLGNPRFNLAMSSDGVNFRYPPWLDARISPRLSLQLSDRRLSLLGTVVVPRAEVSIVELPEGAVRLSRDEVIVLPEAAGNEPEASPAIRFAADLNVRLGDSVTVTGRGLQADLAGQFRVQYSDATAPMLRGEVNVTGGSWKAYGQDLDIRRGRLLFVGPIGETAIDVEAERTVGSQRAGVILSGRFTAPEVDLYAVPTQTPENTLSYILLGRPLTADTNNSEDANAVAAAALSLGVRGAQGIAGQIGERFGIEELELEATGTGDEQQVAISGRLSDRLTARYGVGIMTPENTLTLRYELTRRLFAEITQSVESALDLYYSFEF